MEQNLCGKTKEEILEMLSTIKEICIKQTCADCPFGSINDKCHLSYTPDSWKLHDENSAWRALE